MACNLMRSAALSLRCCTRQAPLGIAPKEQQQRLFWTLQGLHRRRVRDQLLRTRLKQSSLAEGVQRNVRSDTQPSLEPDRNDRNGNAAGQRGVSWQRNSSSNIAMTASLTLFLASLYYFYTCVSEHDGKHSAWHFRLLKTLPLNSISRLWGRLNEIDLPIWMRDYGYRLYSFIFGCNLDEIREKDLTKYRNLAEFFYRQLEPGVRPIGDSLVVSPADGRVLHLGIVQGRQIEQIKGHTYSLDRLLGNNWEDGHSDGQKHGGSDNIDEQRRRQQRRFRDDVKFERENPELKNLEDTEFAELNGIPYSLSELLAQENGIERTTSDAAVKNTDSAAKTAWNFFWLRQSSVAEANEVKKRLFFAVIYLAPGDYHRFHSPTSWVVEKRRHCAGDLYSVSPYIVSKLANIFVLNERVALLGRYRWGFFSVIPVGATNVGSIRIHFDKDLRTNTVLKDRPVHAISEATYARSSRLLGGHPLAKGEEMGGFSLGSTVVMVFEAPESFKFFVKPGDRVKVGQSFGDIS